MTPPFITVNLCEKELLKEIKLTRVSVKINAL